MTILAWTCRRLGHSSIVQRLKQLMKNNNPHLFFLIETLAPLDKVSSIIRSNGFTGICGLNPERHSGGLLWAWKDNFQVTPIQITRHWIHIKVEY